MGLLDCIPVVYYYSTSAGFARSGARKLGEKSLVRLVAGNLKGGLVSRGDNRRSKQYDVFWLVIFFKGSGEG